MLSENTAAATTSVSQGPGVASRRRRTGSTVSQISAPGARNRAEYFDRQARPAASPAASHQPGRSLARARQHRVAIQNGVVAASGTASTQPAPISRVAAVHQAARSAVRAPAPSWAARSKASRLAARLASTGTSRTPRGVSPKSARPAAIHQAIIGG